MSKSKKKKKCEGSTNEEKTNPGAGGSGVPGCTRCKHLEEHVPLAAVAASGTNAPAVHARVPRTEQCSFQAPFRRVHSSCAAYIHWWPCTSWIRDAKTLPANPEGCCRCTGQLQNPSRRADEELKSQHLLARTDSHGNAAHCHREPGCFLSPSCC